MAGIWGTICRSKQLECELSVSRCLEAVRVFDSDIMAAIMRPRLNFVAFGIIWKGKVERGFIVESLSVVRWKMLTYFATQLLIS